MKKAVAVPYVIALILGVIVIGLLGYWFLMQGSRTVGVGNKAECDALKVNYCKGFVATWKTECGTDPRREGGECGYTCGDGKISSGTIEVCDKSGGEDVRYISEGCDPGKYKYCNDDCLGWSECR